mmetsp:Transcript_112273/g.194979  ORF Transcript_112273/g.194979 Transcript_112273/m.194979 type:complete len:201 (-) Transcript_112273:1565-2167(-)
MTRMRSAFWIVDSRCATTTVVRPSINFSIACCTICSDSPSRALVASSRSRIEGSRTRARAMATRCRWPPLSLSPLAPHLVSYPSFILMMNSWAKACFAASSTFSLGTSSNPRQMFSVNEFENNTGSWFTTVIAFVWKYLGSYLWTGTPSMSTLPWQGSYIPRIILMTVDLPPPLGPTRATTSPGLMCKLKLVRIGVALVA